jgi:hypothetical protein
MGYVTTNKVMSRNAEIGNITVDHGGRDLVRRLFETAYGARMYNPMDSECALDELVGARRRWAEQDKTVVFTAGGYDLLHLNHKASVLGAKILGVRHRYESSECSGAGWVELSPEEQVKHIKGSLESDEVKLVVSVKGDAELGKKKSFQANKGNGRRPIQDWRTRATSLLTIGVPGPFSCDPNQLVDAVTIDDNVDPRLAESPSGNLVDLVHELEPDVWQIYAESGRLLDFVARGELKGKTRVFKSEAANYFTDGSSGEPLSTTLTVNKVLGKISTENMVDHDRDTT